MKHLKNKHLWAGIIIGTVIGPPVLARFAPKVKSSLPG